MEILYTNACSIRNKCGELSTRCVKSNVIAITETWLQAGEATPKDFESYISYRQDRNDGRHGGGVLLFVDGEFGQWEADFVLATPNVQAISCYISVDRSNIGVLCVYRSPHTRDWEDTELLVLLKGFTQKTRRFVILGDFNLPSIDWEVGWAPNGSIAEDLLDWLHLNAFAQHVKEATRFREGHEPSILDLAITRYASEASSVVLEDPLGKSDHVVLKLQFSASFSRSQPKLIRQYGRMDIEGLREQAQLRKWLPDGVLPTIEDRWAIIKAGLLELTETFAPLRPMRNKQRPVWWKPKVGRAISCRRNRWLAFKLHRTSKAWAGYKEARNRAQIIQRSCKYEYECKIAQQAKQNPKRFYGYMQAKMATREKVNALEKSDGTKAISDQDKATTLLEYFCSVYRNTTMADPDPNSVDRQVPCFQTFTISGTEVGEELKALNRFKSAGPDGLHPAIIQPLADILH